jgi:hypothetical protein
MRSLVRGAFSGTDAGDRGDSRAGKFVVAEPAIEIRRLERKGFEPGGMAAEIATVALGLGHQAASVSGPRPFRACLGRVNCCRAPLRHLRHSRRRPARPQ